MYTYFKNGRAPTSKVWQKMRREFCLYFILAHGKRQDLDKTLLETVKETSSKARS